MVGVVIVGHGSFAQELINTSKFIVGKVESIEAVNLKYESTVEEIRSQISSAIKKVDTGGGVLILTDMFGGTPSNISLSFLKEGEIEVLSGVNLPMLLKLSTSRDEMKLEELATYIKSYGQKNISLASEILARRTKK
jgi:mannose PTS system EIIA component